MQDQKEEMASEFHAIAIILFSLLLYSCMFDFYLAKKMLWLFMDSGKPNARWQVSVWFFSFWWVRWVYGCLHEKWIRNKTVGFEFIYLYFGIAPCISLSLSLFFDWSNSGYRWRAVVRVDHAWLLLGVDGVMLVELAVRWPILSILVVDLVVGSWVDRCVIDLGFGWLSSGVGGVELAVGCEWVVKWVGCGVLDLGHWVADLGCGWSILADG